MTYIETLEEINTLVQESNGHSVQLGSGDELSFERIATYTLEELSSFEREIGFILPHDFKLFLTNVGASKVYFDEYGLGVEILSPEDWFRFSEKIFQGRSNPFPNILIIATSNGSGNLLAYCKDPVSGMFQLSVLSPDEDPEMWLSNSTNEDCFQTWLEKLHSSDGEF